MKDPSTINELLSLFCASMAAVISKLLKAAVRPSLTVIIAEVIVGCSFCFIIAPALAEWYGLSIKVACLFAWIGSYFSSLLIKSGEDIIQAWVSDIKKAFRKGGKL